MTLHPARLRIAIVGAGYVASHHLAALQSLDFVEVVGICDSDQHAAARLARRFGVSLAVASLDALAPARPQAIYVLTPPASHAALALAALDMGCHVLVEKPMADTPADCEAMIARARDRGLILGVNHSDLFDPAVLRALRAVAAGRIGEVLSVDVIRGSDYPAYAGGPLPAQVTQGSYPFRDLGVHGLYTIEALLGPIGQLHVECQSRGRDPNLRFDEWQGLATCERGAGRLLLSWNARPMENRLVVRGTAGCIEVDRFLQTCRVQRVLPGPKFVGIVLNALLGAASHLVHVPWNVLRFASRRLEPSPGIRQGARAFAEAVRDHASPPFSGEDALRIARLVDVASAGPDALRRDELAARLTALPPADALVTGANGFLGRRLVARLRAEGKRVRVLVRRPEAGMALDPGLQVVVGDLGDPLIVAHAVCGAAVVYHVGATMRGTARDFEAGTVCGTRNVVDACRDHGVSRLVYVSSMSVFDHAGRDPAGKMHEDSMLEPHPAWRGAYTQTKLSAERYVRQAIDVDGLPAVIIRPGQIFGPGAERTTPNGVLGLAGRWIAVGSGTRTVPAVYVDDVVDALLHAASVPAAVGRCFNIVDDQAITQQRYIDHCQRKLGPELRVLRVPAWMLLLLGGAVEALGKLLGRDMPLTRYRVRSLRPLSNFDGSAARTCLGWVPAVGLERGLQLTFGAPAPSVPDLDDRQPMHGLS